MLRWLVSRETGEVPPQAMARAEAARRAYDLDLSGKREISCANYAAFTSLAIDLVEARYLLAGSGDGGISVFDLHQFGGDPRRRSTIEPLFLAKRGHTHGVSSIAWYTHDTGMFFSGSFDHKVNAWDTNTQRVVCQFEMPLPVYCISLSPIATRHALVAAGSGDQKVRLCDPMTGGSTHCLLGHREAILAVQWSPTNEYLLASASVDKTIRLWDIRRSGCLLSLDQHNSQTAFETNRTLRLKNVGAKGGAPTSVTAHDEPVTSLCWSPDGLFLYSSGKDNKIHMWNTDTGRNTLVNFAGVKNAAEKASQMAISSDGQVLYHPNGSDILPLEAHSGRSLGLLRGHFDRVNCCVFHPHLQELYSGGNDNQLLCWVPSTDETELEKEDKAEAADRRSDERPTPAASVAAAAADGDAWSDDDEGDADGDDGAP